LEDAIAVLLRGRFFVFQDPQRIVNDTVGVQVSFVFCGVQCDEIAVVDKARIHVGRDRVTMNGLMGRQGRPEMEVGGLGVEDLH